jgi:ubiquinol oxidase
MKDLLLYVRADKAKHREVNHTLGNLDQKNDPNPFASKYKDPTKPYTSKRLADLKGISWAREEAL